MLPLLILLSLPARATQDPQVHIQKAQERLQRRDYEGTSVNDQALVHVQLAEPIEEEVGEGPWGYS